MIKTCLGRGRRSTRRLAYIAAAAALVTAAFASAAGALPTSSTAGGAPPPPNPRPSSIKGTVCLFFPNQVEPGWVPFAKSGIAAFKKYMPNMAQLTYDGNNSAATQLSQVQACIAHKATLAVISPPVPTQAGASLKLLADAHIPTIAQDNDPDGGPVYAYVWVNFQTVGQYFGKYMTAHLAKQVGHKPVRVAEILGDPTFVVYHDWLKGMSPYLNKLIANGTVKIVCKTDTVGWAPTTAQTHMQQCLTKTGNGVDAVLMMNDSTGDGIAAALQSQHLLGKIKLYGGHDSSLTALQRVIAGDQIATFHPNNQEQFGYTIQLAEAALAGKSAASTGLINYQFPNGFVKGGVPTIKAPEQVVTSANIAQTVVAEGLYTKAQLCTSLAANSSFCKKK
jgi:D-xylose transport system substrate-binding protein